MPPLIALLLRLLGGFGAQAGAKGLAGTQIVQKIPMLAKALGFLGGKGGGIAGTAGGLASFIGGDIATGALLDQIAPEQSGDEFSDDGQLAQLLAQSRKPRQPTPDQLALNAMLQNDNFQPPEDADHISILNPDTVLRDNPGFSHRGII